ncbi:MAG: hypothetical protein HWE07_14115 [Cytophagia bacterium]|nr:hypothetical protein [Cytophagia bacterium]
MKITVKHYLNTRLKPNVEIVGKEEVYRYPIYIQVIANGKQAQFRSRVDLFYAFHKGAFARVYKSKIDIDRTSQKEFEKLLRSPKNQVFFNAEIDFVKNLLIELNLFGSESFSLRGIASLRDKLFDGTTSVFDKFQDRLVDDFCRDYLHGLAGMKAMLKRWSWMDQEMLFYFEGFVNDLSKVSKTNLSPVKKQIHRFSTALTLYNEFLWKNYQVNDLPLYFFLNRNYKVHWYEYLTERFPNNRRYRVLIFKFFTGLVTNHLENLHIDHISKLDKNII